MTNDQLIGNILSAGGILLLVSFFAFGIFMMIYQTKRYGLKNIMEQPKLEMENTKMLNELLKRKLEKGESLSPEEVILMQQVNKTQEK